MKEFSLDTYDPIDYQNWIFNSEEAKRGANLKRLDLLNPGEWKVWDHSYEWRGSRGDPEQEENVTRHALTLLRYLPGTREVVGVAAMLHDTGMKDLFSKDEWKAYVETVQASGKSVDTPEIRLPHEFFGCLIAGKVMDRANYPHPKYHRGVALAIGGHDSGTLTLSDNARIIRAADLFWRVSSPCVNLYLSGKPVGEVLNNFEKNALCDSRPTHMLEGVALAIGRVEAANSLYFQFGDSAVPILKARGYGEELERVTSLYTSPK